MLKRICISWEEWDYLAKNPYIFLSQKEGILKRLRKYFVRARIKKQ